MTDPAVVAVSAPVPASNKASAASKKVPATKPAHPPTFEMVNVAIASLKDRKGSSLAAIKKYIATNYVVDVDRQSAFIRRYLRSAVEKNILVQTKGTGANGRFKLTEGEKKKMAKMLKDSAATAKKPVGKKAASTKKVDKEGAAEKSVATKKTAVKKPATAKKDAPAKESKVKTSSKAKKGGKSPVAAKPKTPKPKKTTASKTATK